MVNCLRYARATTGAKARGEILGLYAALKGRSSTLPALPLAYRTPRDSLLGELYFGISLLSGYHTPPPPSGDWNQRVSRNWAVKYVG